MAASLTDEDRTLRPEQTRVLVLGAGGLLGGYVLRLAIASGFETHAWYRVAPARISGPIRIWSGDVATEEAVDLIASTVRPTVVVNCAALLPRRQAAAAEMKRVNTWLPHRLAARLSDRGARVVQVSTDAVFSGAKGGYGVGDPPDPQDVYGSSKAEGELATPHLTVRATFAGVSDVANGGSLLEWLLRQRGTVSGYARAYASDVSALNLARVLIAAAARPSVGGILHVASPRTSKLDLCRALVRAFCLRDVSLVAVDEPAYDRSLLPSDLGPLCLNPQLEEDQQWSELAADALARGVVATSERA